MGDDGGLADRLLRFLDRHERVPAGSMIRLHAHWSCGRCGGDRLSTTPAPACAACGEAAPPAGVAAIGCTCGKPLFRLVTGTLYDEDNYAEGEVGAAECVTCGRIVPFHPA